MSDSLFALNQGPGLESPVAKIQPEELTSKDKLKRLHRKLRESQGDDYDPVLRLAELAEQCVAEGDMKTAVTALNSVADRLYPKLKAYEIDDGTADKPVIIDGSATTVTDASEPAAKKEYRFGNKRLLVE